MNRIHCRSLIPAFLVLLALHMPAGFLLAQGANPKTAFAQARVSLDAGRYEEAWTLFRQAHELDRANRTYTSWLMYVSVFQGQTAIYANDHERALMYFNTALEMKKDLDPDEKSANGELYTIRRYIDLIKEHARYSGIKPQYIHRVQALYIKHTDLKDVVDANGKPVVSKGDIADELIEGSVRYQNMLKFYIETLTKGRVSLSFDRRIVDTTLTRAYIHVPDKKTTKFRPDFNSTTESLGPILFEGRNRYDTTIYYFNNDNFTVMIYAMGVPNIYIPYTWYGPARGSVGLMLGAKTLPKNPTYTSNFTHIWIIFHEFFHVIERMSGGIQPQHAYLSENMARARQNYPDWIPDMNPVWTATEYSWYRYHLHNTVPERMEKKAAETGLHPPFRNFSFVLTEPDRTEEYVFNTYTAAVKGISLDNLRKASELLEEAYKLRREKKSDESIEALKKALGHNPYHHRVLIELGGEMMKKKDFIEADRYYGTMAQAFPDPKELFEIAKSLLDRGQPALAAKYFRIVAERPGRNPVYTRWLARALYAAGDRDAADEALARVETNPAMKSRIAYITNTGTGNALYSMANPEGGPAPGLARPGRQEGCRWKLVPSGDRDSVMIVSDHSWKCIEARGENGSYTVRLSGMEESDSKKWRLVRTSGSLYRIISKTSGAPLAVVLSEDGKKSSVTLSSAGANQEWEIQELDSSLSRMDFTQTVGFISSYNNLALDLYSGKTEDGAAIKLWPRTGNANQQWKIVPSGDPGYVYIVAVKTWKCLTARRDSNTFAIVQTGVSGTAAQKWRMVPRDGNGCILINKEFNSALEADASKPSSRELRLGAIVESENQIWNVE